MNTLCFNLRKAFCHKFVHILSLIIWRHQIFKNQVFIRSSISSTWMIWPFCHISWAYQSRMIILSCHKISFPQLISWVNSFCLFLLYQRFLFNNWRFKLSMHWWCNWSLIFWWKWHISRDLSNRKGFDYVSWVFMLVLLHEFWLLNLLHLSC